MGLEDVNTLQLRTLERSLGERYTGKSPLMIPVYEHTPAHNIEWRF